MNKMKVFYALALLLSIFSACNNETAKPLTTCTLPATVSFNQHIVPILNQHCNTSGCHAGSRPSGNLNLEASVAYTALMKKGSGYIDTLTPNYSLLYAQMNSSSNPMPPKGKLDKCTLDTVLKWIQQKAKNN
jgi:hypothetical protein